MEELPPDWKKPVNMRNIVIATIVVVVYFLFFMTFMAIYFN